MKICNETSSHTWHVCEQISHELRTPLCSILASLSILNQVLGNEERKSDPAILMQLLRSVEHAAKQMDSLVEDLLDQVKQHTSRFSVKPRPTPLQPLIEEARELIEPLLREKKLSLDIAIEPGMPFALCDPRRILQVIINLLSNAVKHSPYEGKISVGALRNNSDELHIFVADTGPGIAFEQVPFIFDRYWQAPQNDQPGLGLGLSIARDIVLAHSGKIWVENAPHHGAVFYFNLKSAIA